MNISDVSESLAPPNRRAVAGSGTLRWLLRAAMLSALAPALAACTNAMLSSARTSISAGNYAQAHQQLEAALHDPSLTATERREVRDNLCAAEVQLGAPTYSLTRQHQTCAEAAREPGSSSGERLAKIDAALGAQDEAEFDRALKARNIAGAAVAVRDYEHIEPNDTQTLARLDRRLWLAIDRQEQSLDRRGKQHVHQALTVLGEDYPGLHMMNQRAFKHWIGKDTSPSGVPMLSAITISGHTLELKVPDDNLKQSALSPEKFARINDAFSVWCQCDGATHVASDSTGLPVYLARLNPSLARSEVLVLPWR